MNNRTRRIAERQNAVSKDWRRFLRQRLSYSIGKVVNRRKAKLPTDFVPWAPGIVMASDHLLRLAGYHSRSGRPKGWRLQPSRGEYRKDWPSLLVRNHGKFWTVEEYLSESVLVFIYGSMPVCTRTYEEAMWLAEYSLDSRPLGNGLCWVGSAPHAILD